MSSTMPVGFVGHGNPLNAVNSARAAPWRTWGARWPGPEAVLVVSAHWEAAPVTIGRVSAHDELLYDYYGFPDFMYQLQYPAPGAPHLADRAEELLGDTVAVRREDRPLDHGAYIPLLHLLPDADVPVIEVSMPQDLSEEALYALGRELAPLRDEGVFILATGNLVHDLRHASWENDVEPPDYASGFDAWVDRALRGHDHEALIRWREAAPDPLRSHPSAEHYRPVLVAAGAAGDAEVRYPVEGFEHGTISRRAVQFD